MFPLYDENPSRTRPVLTWSIIAINVLVFFWQMSIGLRRSIELLGWVPVYHSFPPNLGRALTSMFAHASPFHIFGNMLFLWIFGDNTEDRIGHVKFLFLYLAWGFAATVAHTAYALTVGGVLPEIPAVGASGAISGVIGAYVVFFPRARIVTVIFLRYFIRFVRIPAVYYIGFWFLMQLLFGALQPSGSVAYWAHIGGFLAGVLVALTYKLSKKRYVY